MTETHKPRVEKLVMGVPVASVMKMRRDQFWSVFGVHKFECDPGDCDHPRGLDELLGSRTFMVGRGCGSCGWMHGWPDATLSGREPEADGSAGVHQPGMSVTATTTGEKPSRPESAAPSGPGPHHQRSRTAFGRSLR